MIPGDLPGGLRAADRVGAGVRLRELRSRPSSPPASLFAVVWLGLLGSDSRTRSSSGCSAGGATRTSMVAYCCRCTGSCSGARPQRADRRPTDRRDGVDHRRRGAREQRISAVPRLLLTPNQCRGDEPPLTTRYGVVSIDRDRLRLGQVTRRKNADAGSRPLEPDHVDATTVDLAATFLDADAHEAASLRDVLRRLIARSVNRRSVVIVLLRDEPVAEQADRPCRQDPGRGRPVMRK